MSSGTRNPFSKADAVSVVEELCLGTVPWEAVERFPTQPDADRAEGDATLAELADSLRELIDPDEVDRTGRLPTDVIARLSAHGWMSLGTPAEVGGRALSPYNVARVVHAAASWSMPAAISIAAQESIGVGALLPTIPPGTLRDYLVQRVADGVVSGAADTEPSGAANQGRQTTATPVEDGAAYLINGEKSHITNGAVSDVLVVSATVDNDGQPERRLFAVDTDQPGFRVRSQHRFLGLRGIINNALSFTDVRVPSEHTLVEASPGARDEGRLTPTLLEIVVRGRLLLITAPSLAVARQCVGWMRDFATRRVVDGRPLTEYDHVQRELADSAADTYAIDTVLRWTLLADQRSEGQAVNPLLEQNAAKNIAAITAWRVMDRAMSLMAGEGLETADSKAERGVPPVPLERAYRDLRTYRVSGGVDFQLDYWASVMVTLSYYYPEPAHAADIEHGQADVSWVHRTTLSAANKDHLEHVAVQAHEFARTCLELSRRYPDRSELVARQRLLAVLNETLNELLTITLVLARSGQADDDEAELSDVYCTAARLRLADCWTRLRALADDAGPDHAAVSRRLVEGTGFDPSSVDTIAPTR
jgi:alkylation response protein AidB-like acyl-CoA dehydrogenase